MWLFVSTTGFILQSQPPHCRTTGLLQTRSSLLAHLQQVQQYCSTAPELSSWAGPGTP